MEKQYRYTMTNCFGGTTYSGKFDSEAHAMEGAEDTMQIVMDCFAACNNKPEIYKGTDSLTLKMDEL